MCSIDLGQSDTVVGVRSPEAPARLMAVAGHRSLLSAVYARGASEVLIGPAALAELGRNPRHGIREPKSALGTDPGAHLPAADGSEVPLTTLVARLLAAAYAPARQQHDRPPDALVLTRPSAWPAGGPEEAALLAAVAEAGIDAPRVHAVAAAEALAHAVSNDLPHGVPTIVVDVGAGHVDVAVVEGGDWGCRLLTEPRTARAGSKAVEKALLGTIFERLAAASPAVARRLREAAEAAQAGVPLPDSREAAEEDRWRTIASERFEMAQEAKIALGTYDEHTVHFRSPADVAITLLPNDLAAAHRTLVDAIASAIDETVDDARLDRGPAAVVLAGGGSASPAVREWFADRFPSARVTSVEDALAATAIGALYVLHPSPPRWTLTPLTRDGTRSIETVGPAGADCRTLAAFEVEVLTSGTPGPFFAHDGRVYQLLADRLGRGWRAVHLAGGGDQRPVGHGWRHPLALDLTGISALRQADDGRLIVTATTGTVSIGGLGLATLIGAGADHRPGSAELRDVDHLPTMEELEGRPTAHGDADDPGADHVEPSGPHVDGDGNIRMSSRYDPPLVINHGELTSLAMVGEGGAIAASPKGLWLASRAVAPATGTRRSTEERDRFVASLRPLRVLRGHTYWVPAVAFAPDDKRLATASYDGTARVWQIDGRTDAALRGHADWVVDLAFSPSGDHVATAGRDHSARLWDAAKGHELATFWGHESVVEAVAFSPDGRLLATGGRDHTVRVWDVASAAEVAVMDSHRAIVLDVVFSNDGALLASTGYDRTVCLSNPTTGEHLATLSGHRDVVSAVAFTPDSSCLATASRDHTVILWDSDHGERLRVFDGHTDVVEDLAFSPDGSLLASVGRDRTLRIWDPIEAQLLRTIEAHDSEVLSVDFSRNGALLATSARDHTARIWGAGEG